MRVKDKISEADEAYEILEKEGQPIYFRQLISQVLEGRDEVNEHSWAHAMAEVHTQINMDSRFVHLGKGMWGLVAWIPQAGIKNYVFDDVSSSTISESKKRRERLLEEIQEDYSMSAKTHKMKDISNLDSDVE